MERATATPNPDTPRNPGRITPPSLSHISSPVFQYAPPRKSPVVSPTMARVVNHTLSMRTLIFWEGSPPPGRAVVWFLHPPPGRCAS